MGSVDPLLLTLYAGVLCSGVVTATMLVLAARLRRSGGRAWTAAATVGAIGAVAGCVMLATAVAAPREIEGRDYAMLLNTLTVHPEMGAAFKAAMRDGRITRLELHRISAVFPPVRQDQMRGVARIVANDVP